MEQEIIQESQGNYLKVMGSEDEGFSEKIFSYNEIPGFLPLEVRWINGKKECIYDVTGKIPLRQYLSDSSFTLGDIRKIFLALFEMADRVEEYLLDGNQIGIQSDLLFIDRSTKDVGGVYLQHPVKPFMEAMGELLEEIMEKMNQKDRELVFFIYGMHKLTKEEAGSRRLLKQYVQEENASSEETKIEEERDFVPLSKDARRNEERTSGKKKLCQSRWSPWILPCIIGTSTLLLSFVLWNSGVLREPVSGRLNLEKSAGAAVFLCTVAGYGLWKTLPYNKNKKKKKRKIRTDILPLEEKGENKVCLIPQSSGQEMFVIHQFPFRIGKDMFRTNGNLEGMGVSEIHTCIDQEGGVIFAVDEESEGGTFRNDVRLVPWQKTMLRDGDILRLAGRSYVVEITPAGYVM